MSNSIATIMDPWSMEDVIEDVMDEMDGSTEDSTDEDDVKPWYPEEYVILVNGYRGSGKSLLVAYWGLWYARKGTIPIYSNLDYNIDNLKADGYTNIPNPLDWGSLISFNLEQPLGSLNQIDEIDAHLDKLRTASNQNVLATKFLEQLRKRCLKFILSCQFGHYLPYGTLDQCDIIINAQDLFFTRAGRERGLGKGEKFLYTCVDKSGYFTGGRKQPWFFTLEGRGIWGYYQTNKLHDPTQFAQKYEIRRETTIVGANGEMYPESEQGAHNMERQLGQLRETVGLVWGSQLMGWIQQNSERLNVNDTGPKLQITTSQMEQALSQIEGPSRGALEKAYHQLLKMATSGNGVVNRIRRNTIEILKPEVFGDDVDIAQPISLDGLGYESNQ